MRLLFTALAGLAAGCSAHVMTDTSTVDLHGEGFDALLSTGRARILRDDIYSSKDDPDYHVDAPRKLGRHYTRPQCTGPRERYEFGDGSSLSVCFPKDGDEVFGHDVTVQGNLGQGMTTDLNPMAPDVVNRIRSAVTSVLPLFPFAGPGGAGVGYFVRQLLAAKSINGFEGLFYYAPGDTIWISAPGAKNHDNYLRDVLVHEIVHGLEEHFVGPAQMSHQAQAWRAKWQRTMANTMYSKEFNSRRTYKFTRSSYREGFLTGYSRVAAYEDIAVLGQALLCGNPEVWACHAVGGPCKAKVELVIELLQMLSPSYTMSYFRNLADRNRNSHLYQIAEQADAADLPEGAYSYDDTDDSIETYRKELEKIPHPPSWLVDTFVPPSWPETTPFDLQLGPDTVKVYCDKPWRNSLFYGRDPGAMPRAHISFQDYQMPWVEVILDEAKKALPHGTGGAFKNLAVALQLAGTDGVRGSFTAPPGDTVWLAPKVDPFSRLQTGQAQGRNRGQWSKVITHLWLETLVHEVTHLLVNHYYTLVSQEAGVNFRRRWIDALPTGFRYLGPGGGLHFSPEYYQDGFLSGYSRASFYEDTAQYGAALFVGSHHVWDCARRSQKCAAKKALMIELLSTISPEYNEAYFRSRADDSLSAQAIDARLNGAATRNVISDHMTAHCEDPVSSEEPLVAEVGLADDEIFLK